ncbi:hypothetical protein GYMLUDRAFT_247557 [Collybiopsis luxurians FD-317 M1]|uniref:DUF6532 domain-containing protein n=1 Tax=Collybiopsis luxurians FD-317 M1 TaxID=944289 RepID=A0A0D0CFA7_9AGAR|nr:hypothetical protein GYMLUDRAFT_247557 [Collybiopsis luxurians FD-317 M1]
MSQSHRLNKRLNCIYPLIRKRAISSTNGDDGFDIAAPRAFRRSSTRSLSSAALEDDFSIPDTDFSDGSSLHLDLFEPEGTGDDDKQQQREQNHIWDRVERDEGYRDQIFAYVCGCVSHMRTKVKKAAVSVVTGLYGLQGLLDDQGKKLAEDLWKACCYVFPLSNPFDHPEILSVLKKAFFANPDLPGIVYKSSFKSSVSEHEEKEIPKPMLCLIGVADFQVLVMSKEYDHLLKLCSEKIMGKDGKGALKFHNLIACLYRDTTTGVVINGKH